MSKVAIVTDSNSGMSQENGREYGIYVIPMPFSVDDVEQREGIDIDLEGLYACFERGAEVFTSQPAVVELMALWDELLEEYDEIVHIPMSSGLSSSYQTASIFAQEDKYLDKVFVVNNQRISVTQRYSALEAKKMADNGAGGAEIKKFLEDTRFDASIYITVDTMEYLKKGGRVTPAGAALASVFNIKPVLSIQGEKLDAYSKVRGMKAAKNTMVKAIKKDIEERFGGWDKAKETLEIEIAHTAQKEVLDAYVEEIKAEFQGFDIHIDPLSLSVACHIGPGSLALACSVKHSI